MTDFEAATAAWRQRFEAQLEGRLPSASDPPVQLHTAMRYATLDGGKRFRPVLVYATGKALGLNPDDLDGVASAIEIIHAYSLIHDDLPAMDDDDLRRGRPTCHRAFDEATAILAGDALQALAFGIIASEYGQDERGQNMLAELAHSCGSQGMAGGQAIDLAAVGQRLELEQLENMHRLKTGALIHAAVILPAIRAAAPELLARALSAYADCVGLAFQVHDDILDVTGDSSVTGKASQADAARDKPTFPAAIGLDASRRRARELRDEAIASLDSIPGDTTVLAALADYVIQRDR